MTNSPSPQAVSLLSDEGKRRAIQQLANIQREKEMWASRLGQPGCAQRQIAGDDAEALAWAVKELTSRASPADGVVVPREPTPGMIVNAVQHIGGGSTFDAEERQETFIVDEEGGAPVGICIDLPDGSQIWSGECSSALLEAAAANDESPDDSGLFLMVAAKGRATRVVAQVATIDDGIALARALSRASPPSADADKLLIAREALEPFAAASLDRESQNVKTLPGGASVRVTLAQCRKARQALARLSTTEAGG